MDAAANGSLYADVVVRHGPAGEPVLGPALVAWRDGVLQEVTPCTRDELARLPADPARWDLGRCVVAPAWVNAHTHLAMSALRGLGGDAARRGNVVEELWFRIEAGLGADDVRAFTRLGALECLLAGTGAVFDHYYFGDAVAQALADVGLCGVVAPTLQDLAGPGAADWAAALATTEQIAEDGALEAAGIVAALGPHASDTVSPGLWARALALAERRRLPVHVHVAQSRDEVDRALGTGARSPIDRVLRAADLGRAPRTLLVHGLYTSRADIAALDPARVVHVHCPASQAQFAFPADLRRWAPIPIALGTDSGACNDTMNVQREMFLLGHADAWRTPFDPATGPALDGDLGRGAARVAAHRDAVFQERAERADPWAVLQAVWSIPGDVHPALRVGRIEAGARANLAAYDLDHPALWPGRDPLRGLAYGDAAPALHTLVVAGRAIGQVGDVGALRRDPRVAAWVAEASARLDALLDRYA